jgi:hypothetical protein
MCDVILRGLGFRVSSEDFEFSAAPARWGPPLAAALLAIIALAAGHMPFIVESQALPFVTALGGLLVVGLAARWLARNGTRKFPLARMRSTNLVGVRGNSRAASPGSSPDSRPRVWLVAHLDSKSQTIPMLLRVLSVVAFAVLFAALLVTLLVLFLPSIGIEIGLQHQSMHELKHVALALCMAAAASLLPLMLCFIGNRSPGALDNASGVAAVMLAAELVPPHMDLAVLITSGEELGLAGARAFLESQPSGVAVNCDTIDDAGKFIFMTTGERSKRLEAKIARAVERSASAENAGNPDIRRMIPGILADNIAFTDAGWESFTVSRGNLGTLARVHTSRDRVEAVEGAGVAHAARLLAALVEELS